LALLFIVSDGIVGRFGSCGLSGDNKTQRNGELDSSDERGKWRKMEATEGGYGSQFRSRKA
jgi:hypothetical protein